MKKKAESLNEAVRKLQWRIYLFQEELEQKGQPELAELAGEGSFEMDITQLKLGNIIAKFEGKW